MVREDLIEISEEYFYNELSEILPFLGGQKIVTKNKSNRGITIISLEKLLIDSNVNLDSEFIFEDIIDNKFGLNYLYKLFFENTKIRGSVLFFTPHLKTNNGNFAVILPAEKLQDFFIRSHIEIYPETFNVGMFDFSSIFMKKKNSLVWNNVVNHTHFALHNR